MVRVCVRVRVRVCVSNPIYHQTNSCIIINISCVSISLYMSCRCVCESVCVCAFVTLSWCVALLLDIIAKDDQLVLSEVANTVGSDEDSNEGGVESGGAELPHSAPNRGLITPSKVYAYLLS
jgi:hypothetical protein